MAALLNTDLWWAGSQAVEPEIPWSCSCRIAARAIRCTDATGRAAFSAFKAAIVAWIIDVAIATSSDALLSSKMKELTNTTAHAGLCCAFASQASAVAQFAALSGGVEISSIRACRQACAFLEERIGRSWETCKTRGWCSTAAALARKGAW